MVVYKLTSPSNKVYIGQTEKGLDWRSKVHYYSSNCIKSKAYNTKICKAIRKYGIDSFQKEILFESDDANIINEKEIEYIKLYKSYYMGYNMTFGGQKGPRGHKWNDEQRKNLSKSHMGLYPSNETRKLMSLHNSKPRLGIPHTKKELLNLSIKNTGANNAFFGKFHSEFTKLKMIEAHKKREKVKCKYCPMTTLKHLIIRFHDEKCNEFNSI